MIYLPAPDVLPFPLLPSRCTLPLALPRPGLREGRSAAAAAACSEGWDKSVWGPWRWSPQLAQRDPLLEGKVRTQWVALTDVSEGHDGEDLPLSGRFEAGRGLTAIQEVAHQGQRLLETRRTRSSHFYNYIVKFTQKNPENSAHSAKTIK